MTAEKSQQAKEWYARLTPEQKAARVARNRERKTPEKRTQYKEANRLASQDRRRKFTLLKLGRPCFVCGGMFPPECLDWDHRPGTEKAFNISDVLGGAPFNKIVDEIAKCDLVCANCHRVRTESRKA
jgi:hypothetical protein